jgi:hypothetical protein
VSGILFRNKNVFEAGIWFVGIAFVLFILGGIFGGCCCAAAIFVVPGLVFLQKKIFLPLAPTRQTP